jgi:hypothetical protein
MREAGDDARVRRLEKRRRPEPRPDFSGWTADRILVWAARNGQYEEMVAKAGEGHRPAMVTSGEPEAGLPATGQSPADSDVAAKAPPPDDSPVAAAEPRPEPKPEPERQLAYWEEKCRWRHRGPDDYDWDDQSQGYECEHEYDALERGWQEFVRSQKR